MVFAVVSNEPVVGTVPFRVLPLNYEKSKERQELADTPLPLEARISVLPCRGGENLLRRLFEPLGYEVSATRHPLDEEFPEWGE